jgi:fatty acid desaturase
MRFPKMTTRRCMVAVASAAVIACGERSRRQWVARWPAITWERTTCALDHEFERVRYQGLVPTPFPPNPMRAAYHAQMKKKWEWAARYPWLPVEPDPPEPK